MDVKNEVEKEPAGGEVYEVCEIGPVSQTTKGVEISVHEASSQDPGPYGG